MPTSFEELQATMNELIQQADEDAKRAEEERKAKAWRTIRETLATAIAEGSSKSLAKKLLSAGEAVALSRDDTLQLPPLYLRAIDRMAHTAFSGSVNRTWLETEYRQALRQMPQLFVGWPDDIAPFEYDSEPWYKPLEERIAQVRATMTRPKWTGSQCSDEEARRGFVCLARTFLRDGSVSDTSVSAFLETDWAAGFAGDVHTAVVSRMNFETALQAVAGTDASDPSSWVNGLHPAAAELWLSRLHNEWPCLQASAEPPAAAAEATA